MIQTFLRPFARTQTPYLDAWHFNQEKNFTLYYKLSSNGLYFSRLYHLKLYKKTKCEQLSSLFSLSDLKDLRKSIQHKN
jgi:hypothetical protein